MKLHVDLKENGYDILMEHGILYHLNDYIDLNRKVMIVTDSGVPEAYANIVREQCKKGYVHVIEPVSYTHLSLYQLANNSFSLVCLLYHAMNHEQKENGMDRTSYAIETSS